MEKFDARKWQRLYKEARVKEDYSTMNLQSNIDQEWDSSDVILDDLRQYIDSATAAGGLEMAQELASTFKLIYNYALGKHKELK